MAEATLLLLLALFIWPLALFPLAMRLWARPAPPFDRLPDDQLPPITLIICALNEARVIRAKMDNCLELDYPPGKLNILVINDGSTDETAAIVREYGSRGIRLIDHPTRRGKVTNLNEAAPAAETPIVAFSDANVIYDLAALRRLAEHFARPEAGGVTGRVILVNTTDEFRSAEQNYYSLEWAVHAGSTAIHSMVGCDGAMYALRRELFRVTPPDTLIEDFVQALAVVRQGRRMIYEPRAVAWEEGPQTLREEYRRKVRIAAGAAQALLRGNGWPVGAPARFWALWISHKLLRWLAPVTGLATVAAAAANPGLWLSRIILAGAALITLLAVLRLISGWRHPLLNAPFYFVFGLTAGLNGLFRGATGRQKVLWSKANR
jgi:poly-beta-1,6-N-acetyl-D-glucosamine synthase